MSELFIGIDIGGTTAKIGLVKSETGEIIKKTQVKTEKNSIWKTIINAYLTPVKEWIKSVDDVKGIGIGIPGLYDQRTSTLNNCENIPSLINAPFLDYIKDEINLPVFVDNDATCATSGEHVFGSAKNYENCLFITIGTGVGGGLIINNHIFRGKNGFAGEVGHVIVVPDGRKCTCGNYGCLETYSSATALVKKIKSGLKKGYIKNYPATIDKVDAKLVCDLAEEGEIYSLQAFDEMCRYLGQYIGGMINTLNLDAVIIGGGIGKTGKFLIDRIKFYSCQVGWKLLSAEVEFKAAELLNDAGILGAASLCIEEMRECEC